MLGLLPVLLATADAAEVTTKDSGHVQNPVWAPDGSWVAFEINNMSNTVELWLTKVNGSSPGTPSELRVPGAASSFGSGGYMAGSSTWASAPNLMVIFEGSNAGGTMRLYYATPGAGAPNELITASQIGGNLGAPDMNSSGSMFAFISDKTGAGDVYVWDINGGSIEASQVTPGTENAPDWNAGGDTLAYSRKNSGNQDLFTWQSGGLAQPLKGGNGDQTRPVWVGDKVAYFTSERGDGVWDVAVANPSDKSRSIVARDVRLPTRSAPAITPDGQWVAYGSADPDKSDRIFVSRLDGSSTVEIKTGHEAAGEPALVEAGGRLLLAYTALPAEGSDWRRLHIIDITGQL